jgi:hypothetical protein
MAGGHGEFQSTGAHKLFELLRLPHIEHAVCGVLKVGVHEFVWAEKTEEIFPIRECHNVVVRVKKLIEFAEPAEKSAQKSQWALRNPALQLVDKRNAIGWKIAERKQLYVIPGCVDREWLTAEGNDPDGKPAATLANGVDEIPAFPFTLPICDEIDAARQNSFSAFFLSRIDDSQFRTRSFW